MAPHVSISEVLEVFYIANELIKLLDFQKSLFSWLSGSLVFNVFCLIQET